MPTYEVTDPQSGRVLQLTGDTPPTEQDLDQIFAQYKPTPQKEQVDDVPEWGRGEVGANLYGAYGAVKETGKSLIPYLKYLDPKDREEFMKKNQQGQTNQLLKDALEAEIFVAFPAIAKTVGSVAGAVGERVAPKLTKALTKERHLVKKPVPEVPNETPVPKLEERTDKPVEQHPEVKEEPVTTEVPKGEIPNVEPKAPEIKVGSSEPTTELPVETQGKPAKSPERIAQQSRVFERLQQEHPEALEGTLEYTKINLEKEAEVATDLIANNPQKAYRLAMNLEESPDVTNTAVNIAMSDKALLDGNYTLYSNLVKNRSLAQTRRGQEIVTEKGSVTDNSTARYVRELVSTRLEKFGKTYFEGITGKLVKKSNKAKSIEAIDNVVSKAQKRMTNKELDIKEAQSIIDALMCR